MMITIEQALQPLLLTFAILGFGVYFPMKTYLNLLNIFYNLTIWIVYIYLYFYLIIEFKVEKYYLEISNVINTLISIFIIIISIIMNIYYNKKFQIFIKRLDAVDNTLEKLGTPKTYHKLNTYVKRVLIGWLVSINLINIIDMMSVWRSKEDKRNLIFPYISNYHHHVNMFMDLLLATLLWYIGSRFDKINEHIRFLLIKEEFGLRCTWRKTVLIVHRDICSYYKRVLWTSMHLHLELCQIARELNGMFEIQMTMEMINCMMCFMRFCRFLYIHMRIKFFLLSPLHWLSIQMWLSLYGIRIFCLNYACESVSVKANKMGKIIHQLTDFLRYADVRDEIYQFTLQMIHHPLKFTGLGLFYFGNGLLRRLIMSLITLVILIIQMATMPQDIYYYLRKYNISITSVDG